MIRDVETALQLLSGNPALVEGGRKGQAAVCHVPAGNAEQVHLLLIGGGALADHLAHGDSARQPASMAALLRELLAVKLNIGAAAALGENLLDALVYVSTESVAEVVAMSDALVVTGTNLCGLDATMIAEVERLTLLLVAINDAQVSYHLFPAAPTTASRPARPLASSPSAAGGNVARWAIHNQPVSSRFLCLGGARVRARLYV